MNCMLLQALIMDPDRAWTAQGFGMIRTYLDERKRWRLNIWDGELASDGASRIHDHPWDFTSYVLTGRITNRMFAFDRKGNDHMYKEIVTGEESVDLSEPTACGLRVVSEIDYTHGQSYRQTMEEVHETIALDGTVTLNGRSPPKAEHSARVFWPANGRNWMGARPRPITHDEAMPTIVKALARLHP